MVVWYFNCWLGLNPDKQPESIKVRLPLSHLQQSSQIPGKTCSDFCWRLHKFSWQNVTMGFCSLGVRLRGTEMSQDAERLPAAGERALLSNLLDSPLVVESWHSLLYRVRWGVQKVFKAFIVVSPSFSEWDALLFQCSRNISLVFKCYFTETVPCMRVAA